MFQSFENTTSPATCAARLAELRRHMRRLRVDALLVPRSDEHQGEYVAPSAERLRWLTSFTGSAGLAVVAHDKAVLLVDGRYTTQAKAQTDTSLFEVRQITETFDSEAERWLASHLERGQTAGLDLWLHTIDQVEGLGIVLARVGLKLKGTKSNVVDAAWGADRPTPPPGKVMVHPERFAGVPARDKLAALQADLVREGDTAMVLTQPDNIAWLFNIRGSDVAHTPIVLAFALVPSTGKARLFLDARKLDKASRAHLKPLADVLAPSELGPELECMLAADNARVRIDPRLAAAWFLGAAGKRARTLHRAPDLVTRTKARKSDVELAGARHAQVRDGAAMCRYLAWLDRTVLAEAVDEIAATRKLEDLRRETGELREISFDTISGSGPNGAIVHYRVTPDTNRRLQPGELFLIDSGGQYADGTTDITRTVAIGEPSDEMRRRFTLVLKGHIAIATAKFPVGTRGIDLDAFARRALWAEGLDYDHGTGHGVGSFLSVHEGPQSISRRGLAILEPGMICSNEPGYYKPGAYGIRLENLVVVSPAEAIAGGERPMHAFETITLAPFDRRLVLPGLLTTEERTWLDGYHARVGEVIGPLLGREDRAWLTRATAPLAR